MATRPVKVGHQAGANRIALAQKDDRNRPTCGLGRARRAAPGRDDDRHPTLNQIGRKAWQSVELPICPSRFDRNGLTLNVTALFETLPKRGQELHVRISRSRAHEANDRYHRLLRARRERPRSGRTAEQGDELATLHSMTSSATSSRSRGTSRLSNLAVLRLMTNSYLVGCSMGRSAGLA